MHGLDIYTSEVDDKGIDFVARKGMNQYWEVQVKSLYKSRYSYFAKRAFDVEQANLLIAVVLFVDDHPPNLYLIHAMRWQTPNGLLVSRDYVDKKSEPEWGIQLSKKNMPLLYPYAFDLIVSSL